MNTASKYDSYANEIKYKLPQGIINLLPSKHGAFIFAAYGCVLTERQTPSGMYVYTVVNTKTGKIEILSRRKNQLTESGYANMAAKIYASPIRGESSHTTDKKPDEVVKGSKLASTANHIFSIILPKYGYTVRDSQIELVQHILEVIERRGISLAESEVGTGKTHAYLIAAILAKRGRLNDFWLRGHYKNQSWADSAYMPVVISTSSIALQKAIVIPTKPKNSPSKHHQNYRNKVRFYAACSLAMTKNSRSD